MSRKANEWLQAVQAQAAKAIIQASGCLGGAGALQRGTYETPGDVETAVAEARAELAALQEGNVVQIGGKAPRDMQVRDAMDEASDHVAGSSAWAGPRRRRPTCAGLTSCTLP